MSEPVLTPIDTRRRRLLFRATHRGTQENDILIGGYVRRRMDTMSDTDMDALEEVLELPDAELADWLTGRKPIPPDVDTPTLRAIRAEAGTDAPQKGPGR